MVNGTHNALDDDANNRSFLNADNGEGAAKITATLNTLLADVFTLYFKTKNFHWHTTGPHFRWADQPKA
jgi:starvation-inducible DNA-binding protein